MGVGVECCEDRQTSIPCECGGNIIKNRNYNLWECDTCDVSYLGKEVEFE